MQLPKTVNIIGGSKSCKKEKVVHCVFSYSRLLRSAKTLLEKDLSDKYSSLGIDGKCSTLNNFSKDIHFAPHSVTIQQQ